MLDNTSYVSLLVDEKTAGVATALHIKTKVVELVVQRSQRW
jgi:hypothetical protein